MLGRRLGHPVQVVVPENVLPDVGRVLAMYGADIEWADGELGIRDGLDQARRIAQRDGALLLNQFGSPDNLLDELLVLAACRQYLPPARHGHDD
jgi:cysteine synthase